MIADAGKQGFLFCTCSCFMVAVIYCLNYSMKEDERVFADVPLLLLSKMQSSWGLSVDTKQDSLAEENETDFIVQAFPLQPSQ